MRVLCGIVTYNSDITRLKENFKSIKKQVDDIIIFDNGSNNFRDIENLIKRYISNAIVIESSINIGISGALKAIMQHAIDNQYDWVLTLDQDSVADGNLVVEYKKAIRLLKIESVGGLSPIINDINVGIEKNSTEESVMKEVDYCITSGFLCRVEAYKHTPGYDESFFIDNVDFDICYALKRKGYKIYKIPYIGLIHELGHSRTVKVGNRYRIVYNHPPIRRYYIIRNQIWLRKKYPEYFNIIEECIKIIRWILRVFIFEDQKLEKLRFSILGIIDGEKYFSNKNTGV